MSAFAKHQSYGTILVDLDQSRPIALLSNRENERWRSLLLTEPEVLDERELDVCLMKVAHRKVEKYGSVEFERLVYQSDCLVPYKGDEVSLRYDQRNLTAMLAYTRPGDGRPGEFIGVVHARNLKDEQMSLQELRWYKQKLRDRGDEVNHDSIVAERLGLYEFIDQKRQSQRQRRRQANQQHQQQTNASKVIELFPQNDATQPTAQTQSKATKTKPTAEVAAEPEDATPDLPPAVPESEVALAQSR